MENQSEKAKLSESMKVEIDRWQTKLDEAKLQLHLGAKEAQDKIDPHIKGLEQQLEEAKKKWKQFDQAADKAWDDIEEGFKSSFTAMQEAFNKAKKHF